MSSIIEGLIIGGVIWIWVCTFFCGKPWWFFVAYVVSVALTYIFGGLPIPGPIPLWYVMSGIVLVAISGLAAWIILTVLSIRLADYGQMFSINPRSVTFISNHSTVVSIASVLAVTVLIIIYQFIAWMGVGWEIMIGILIEFVLLCSWFLIHRSKITGKSEHHTKRFIFWSLTASALGVLLIFLCLLFRLLTWPFTFVDFWVMLVADGVLVVFALIVLIIMAILYFNDKQVRSETEENKA